MSRAVLLAVLLLACSCSAERRSAPSAWAVASARKHAAADVLLEQGDIAGAQRALEQILNAAPRPGASPRPETDRILLQDTYFRLAQLALDGRRDAEAAQLAGAGLAIGPGAAEDLPVANLLVVRGAAREALHEQAAALEDYDRALRINERLLRDTLEE